MTRSTAISALCALTFVASAGLLVAGPLTPPAGSVASTYKTLSEVQPRVAINLVNTPGDADSMYKITSNGSYYLTADVITIPGKMGIEIAADDVTIDLSGFRVGGYAGALWGIRATGTARRNITVMHGSVWTMSGGGINLEGDDSAANGCRVQDISIRDCGGDGLRVAYSALIDRVDASGCAGSGIVAGSSSVMTSCTARGNGSSGIIAGPVSSITGCACESNGADGISANDGCTVRGCSCGYNAGPGVNASGKGCVLSGCAAYENTGQGLIAVAGATVRDCSAVQNDQDGIYATTGCTVEGCSVKENGGRGIYVMSGCVVRGNVVANSGLGGSAANIHAHNYGNRIEGNSCGFAAVGIEVVGADNIVLRNTCTSNTTNWSIAASNALAPIVVAANNAGVVLGNSYAGSLGSTDPSANYTY